MKRAEQEEYERGDNPSMQEVGLEVAEQLMRRDED